MVLVRKLCAVTSCQERFECNAGSPLTYCEKHRAKPQVKASKPKQKTVKPRQSIVPKKDLTYKDKSTLQLKDEYFFTMREAKLMFQKYKPLFDRWKGLRSKSSQIMNEILGREENEL